MSAPGCSGADKVTVMGFSKRWGRNRVPQGVMRTGSTTQSLRQRPSRDSSSWKWIVGARCFSK